MGVLLCQCVCFSDGYNGCVVMSICGWGVSLPPLPVEVSVLGGVGPVQLPSAPNRQEL